MKTLIISFFSVLICYGSEVVFKIDGEHYTENYFYNFIPKDEWENIAERQKGDVLHDFINRLAVFKEASSNGYLEQPYLAVKLRTRKNQVLVRSSYEYFVALPLVDEDYIDLTHTNLKRNVRVKHLLLGYNGCRLPKKIARSKEGAKNLALDIWSQLIDGVDFKDLALEYSDDPSVQQNKGDLGWLSWGQTVPNFQNAAFSLQVGGFSRPVLTDFGFHIILLEDERDSQFMYMDSTSYDAKCIETAMNLIPVDEKRVAAEAYDNSIIEGNNVVFNFQAILAILDGVKEENKKNKIVASGKGNLISVLNKLTNIGVVCVVNGNGFGLKWFSEHLSGFPASRLPEFKSIENIKTAIRTVILQNIALDKSDKMIAGYGNVVTPRITEMTKNLVYDSYLKYVVNNVEAPSKDAVRSYYETNKDEKYTEYDLVEVRELKVVSSLLSDSLYQLLNEGFDFIGITEQFSLTHPNKGGLIAPFTARRYGPMGEEAFKLEPGEFSKPIENLDGTWSIIFLERRIEKQYMPFERVYSKIESKLKKDLQSSAKESLFADLFEKYNVWINPEFLSSEN